MPDDPRAIVERADREIASADELLARADRYISLARAAVRLNRCHATIRSWVKTGKLKGIRYPSGQYGVSERAVENILSKPL